MNINNIDKELVHSLIIIEKILLKTKIISTLHNNYFNYILSYIKDIMIKCSFLYLEIDNIKRNENISINIF